MIKSDILVRIRHDAAKRILYLPHAVRQMSKPERMITPRDIRFVIENGEIIEDYPDDVRGHSCLILGLLPEGPLHIVCAPKTDYLAIITAYRPIEQEWEDNYRKRKKR